MAISLPVRRHSPHSSNCSSRETALLSHTPPISRAAADTFPMPRDADVIYPNEEGLQAAVLGSGPETPQAQDEARTLWYGCVSFTEPRFLRVIPLPSVTMRVTPSSAPRRLWTMPWTASFHAVISSGAIPALSGHLQYFVNPRLRENSRATPKGALVVGLGTAGS